MMYVRAGKSVEEIAWRGDGSGFSKLSRPTPKKIIILILSRPSPMKKLGENYSLPLPFFLFYYFFCLN